MFSKADLPPVADMITDIEILTQMVKFAEAHAHSEFYIDRPQLLAMMRLVDEDRSGSINKEEFRLFVLTCIEKADEDTKQENAISQWHSSEENQALANGFEEQFKGKSAVELHALKDVLIGLLDDAVSNAK
jgi:hypothetical protein